jgi:hypothetical protein
MRLLASLLFALFVTQAIAQSGGGFVQGQTLNAVDLNNAFARKQDFLVPPATNIFNVLSYGAKGDGITNDSGAFANAFSACSAAGGGIISVPPTGHSYLIATGNVIGNGCILIGVGTKNFPGNSPTVATTTAFGSWIQCTDIVNPCVILQGNGSAIDGINFVRNQVIPSGAYTPIVFPYEISVTATLFRIEHVEMMGSTNGIQLNYLTGSGGGSYSLIRDIWCSCLTVGLQVINTNDTILVDNVNFRNLWYENNINVVAYEEANKIDIDSRYWDNALLNNVEFFHSKCGMQFTDGTVQSVTHSFFNGQANNLTFNLVFGAMCVASGTTHAQGQFSNVFLQTDDVTPNAAAQAFALGSDNINFQFNNLTVADVGKGIMSLGNGAGGNVYIGGVNVKNYSTQTNSNVAFTAAASAQVYITGPTVVSSTNGSAGATTSGLVYLDQSTVSGTAGIAFLGRNVGIGVFPPGFPLDVSGNARFGNLRMDVTQSLTLVNGLNSNISISRGRNHIAGPSAAFSVGGFAAPSDGMRIWLYNPTGQAMTIVNEDGSSAAANRIHTLTGGNVAATNGFAILSYDGTDQRWILENVR